MLNYDGFFIKELSQIAPLYLHGSHANVCF